MPHQVPYFTVRARLDGHAGRTGVIATPHGQIRTPAFIPVGTQATIKGVLPEALAATGAQAVLANAYHLYLRPGPEIVDAAGGLGRFMNWPGPTFTDSGGFQVLSLGAGFKKVLAMDTARVASDDVIAQGSQRMAHVDDDGATFKSHIDGSVHRFTPEISMRVQHLLGADIIFAFDECTTLMNTRAYQERSVERTAAWAERCVAAHEQLTAERADHPAQSLWGVVQGAQYEDLRRQSARHLAALGCQGFGIGGALEKENLAQIIDWVVAELPEDRPRHLLGISEVDDLFAAVEAGADTFDCVAPSRAARHGAILTPHGRYNITRAAYRADFRAPDPGCECYTCTHYTRAYLHHLLRAKETVGFTLATLHNEHFTVNLVDSMRRAIEDGTFQDLKAQTLTRYYAS
jgi:queuine tRNA-ribosyltransferase